MIKILLADDETDSRDAIVQYIDWGATGWSWSEQPVMGQRPWR